MLSSGVSLVERLVEYLGGLRVGWVVIWTGRTVTVLAVGARGLCGGRLRGVWLIRLQ